MRRAFLIMAGLSALTIAAADGVPATRSGRGDAGARGDALFATTATGGAAATAAPSADGACRCGRFAEEVAAAEAVFAHRGDDAALPLTATAHRTFRDRVDRVYAATRCLAACDGVAEGDLNRARVLLAHAAFKVHGLAEAAARERLAAAVAATERCLAAEPRHPGCLLWHASARGILARGSWNPLNARLPRELLQEFRAARDGTPPGRDVGEGGPTRGEATLLLRAPGLVGGDVAAARRLLETAAAAPEFGCTVANRLLLAEALARSGAAERAQQELRAAIAAGLPSCGARRYENALALEEAGRCLRRLAADPGGDPGWNDECQ